MAKYSTGDGGGGASDSCELCGASGVELQTVNVAGAKLDVCDECATHDDNATTRSADDPDDRERRKRAAQNTARIQDAGTPDSSHWEDGADYDDDRLPYLVDGYDERVTEARQASGLQLAELAEEAGVPEADLLAVEQGRAAQAGVGGSVIAALEAYLDVELADA